MGDFGDDTQFYFSLAGNIIVVQIKVEGFRDVDSHPRPTATQASTSRQWFPKQDGVSQGKLAWRVNMRELRVLFMMLLILEQNKSKYKYHYDLAKMYLNA